MNLFKCEFNIWIFLVVLTSVFTFSAVKRYQQFGIWEKTPDRFFVGERPMMTTLDAPYWLSLAKDYNNGTYGKGSLRDYPTSSKNFMKMHSDELLIPDEYRDPITAEVSHSRIYSSSQEIGYKDIPLLSLLIAKVAPFFNYNYYLAGTLLIPILASLFILPLGIYFYKIGLPLVGLMGGLIGTFAGGYYMRSSIGRIDTDMLNLFFPFLSALLILYASKTKSNRNVLLYSIGAGVNTFLFFLWYGKDGFTLVFFSILILSLIINQIRFQIILLSSLLFLLCAQPMVFMKGVGSIYGFLGDYFVIRDSAGIKVPDGISSPASFPNILTTISEAGKVKMDEVFRRILSNQIFGWIGFITFFVLTFFRWRVLIPLLPILALGLFSFHSSNRFIMYLGPFIGIGLGWFMSIILDSISLFLLKYFEHKKLNSKLERKKNKRAKQKETLPSLLGSWLKICAEGTHQEIKNTSEETYKLKNDFLKYDGSYFGAIIFYRLGWLRQALFYTGLVVFFWMISSQTAISFVPRPSIHTGVYATFLEVKKRISENSAILTWWDYGFAISDATGLATFQDGGGLQGRPKTVFTARGLISSDQNELHDIIQFLATEGNEGIYKNNSSSESLLAAVRNPNKKPWDPIYLLFTADMTSKYGAISRIGSWDLKNGGSKPRGYQMLACNSINNKEMNCRGAKINLKTGKINNQTPLRRIVFVRDGNILREQKFGHQKGYTLQIIISGQRILEVQLIDETVFRSNFNQMFLLGRFNSKLYEETYNAIPFSRLFKVKF